MKKLLCGVVLGFSIFALFGCNAKKESVKKISDHLIEVRNNIYVGQDENYYATFCSGQREEPYSLDGVVNDMVEFGIITFSKQDNSKIGLNEIMFTITINQESISGKLEKSPYDNTFSADIEKQVDDNAEITIEVNVNGTAFSQTLFNESKNFVINQQKAIEIAGEELQESIINMKDENGKTMEAMIKILKDFSGESNNYYWYVGIVSCSGETAGILIDANSGEVISKKL